MYAGCAYPHGSGRSRECESEPRREQLPFAAPTGARILAAQSTAGFERTAFAAATARLGRRQVGPWADRDAVLHAKVRAILLGRSVPGDTDSIPSGDLVRLSYTAYRDRQADDDSVGRAAASALLKVAGAVEPDAFACIHAELAAATAAIARLRDDELPEGFDKIDRGVDDDVQDLTVLETARVVELCLAITRQQGHAPWLLAAGDDAQTVRPSGFDWGPLNDLLAARLDALRLFHLEDNLRCPSRIAAVIERASEWYVHLDKARRRTKQRHQHGGQHVDAHLFHIAADVPATVGLLERLDDVEGVVVLTVGDELPARVPERLRDMVLTPADAKGLESPSVCVLEPVRVLARLDAATGPTTTRPSQALRAHLLDVEPPVVAALLRPRLAEPDAAAARGQPRRQSGPVRRRSRCRPRSRRAALRRCRSSSSSRSSSSDPGSRRRRCRFRLRRPSLQQHGARADVRVGSHFRGGGQSRGGVHEHRRVYRRRLPAGAQQVHFSFHELGIGARSKSTKSPERSTLSGTDSPDPASGWSPARQAHPLT